MSGITSHHKFAPLLMSWIYLKKNILLFKFTIFCKTNVIIERFCLLGLFQKFIQLFTKGQLLLQISVHLSIPLVNLPLYSILNLICINIAHFKFLHFLLLIQESFLHVHIIPLKFSSILKISFSTFKPQ